MVGPAHYSPAELAAFLRGHAAGFKAYEDAELADWEPEEDADIPFAEVVEAGGVDFARTIGR